MNKEKKQNVGHSVFERLLNYAKSRGEDFNLLLFRYGIERLLYRLSLSSYSDKFILKGASLFLVWKGQNYRVTRDADLLGFGPVDTENVEKLFKQLCRISTKEIDGVEFLSETVRAVTIREDQTYEGIRVTLVGMLHQARIPLQVDIGFGDVVTPGPERIEFPTLLDTPRPKLLACPRYTMVAEKFEAMVHLGIANSRMKDFYDVWLMSSLFEFEGQVLCDAIRNTFRRRSTAMPDGLPMAFTAEFFEDNSKLTQWKAFVRKSRTESTSRDLDAVIRKIKDFIMPVLETAREVKPFGLFWPQGGPWR